MVVALMWWSDGDGVSTISATSEVSGVHPQTLCLFEGDALPNPARSEGKIRIATGGMWSALGSARRSRAPATSIEGLETMLERSPGSGK